MHIPFPVISDRDMNIAKMYGMLPNMQNATQTVRSVFVIDPEQKIRAILQYPMTNGRSIPEILRLLDAIQITDRDNVVTPANWLPGNSVIVPYPKTYDELLERMKNSMGYNCMDWYLCYKQNPDNMQMMQQNNMMCNQMNNTCNQPVCTMERQPFNEMNICQENCCME